MCCSSVNYNCTLERICRACNVRGDQTGNPDVKCKKMNMHKVRQWVLEGRVDELNAICQKNTYSAWFDVDFGGCKRGVFEAAMPVEALHALEGGIFKQVMEIFITEDLKEVSCKRLDVIVKDMCKWEKQHYFTSGANKEMPRLKWKDGACTLTKISSVYVVGLLLTIVVVLLTDRGNKFFNDKFKDAPGGSKRTRDMRYIFSMLLACWSWLKKKKYWKQGDKEAEATALESICSMIRELNRLWPRDNGNGWNTPKIHEQLHVPGDISRNGTPRESYGGPLEHNHLDTKAHSVRTQRIRDKHDKQLGDRVAETYIIDYSDIQMNHTPESASLDESDLPNGYPSNSTKGKLTLTRSSGRRSLRKHFAWKTIHFEDTFDPAKKLGTQGKLVFDCIEKNYIGGFYHPTNPTNLMNVTIGTEYRREGVIFRAHPDYKGRGPWYDWAMFRYAKTTLEVRRKTNYIIGPEDAVHHGDDPSKAKHYHYAPGKILAFADVGDGEVFAIVLCCAYKHTQSGVFSTYWKVEHEDAKTTKPCVLMISVDEIVRQCLMTPENDEMNGFHEIWDRDRWADTFCSV